jgi:hypothetical protein
MTTFLSRQHDTSPAPWELRPRPRPDHHERKVVSQHLWSLRPLVAFVNAGATILMSSERPVPMTEPP